MSETSDKGYMPGAHPTAPGGMSRKALVTELVDKHGYENDEAAWKQVSWPDLIDLVAAERLEREAEAREAEVDAHVEAGEVTVHETVEEFIDHLDTVADDEPDDLDDLLAEFGLDEETGATDSTEADLADDEVKHGEWNKDEQRYEDGTEEYRVDDFLDAETDVAVEMDKAMADEDGVLDPEMLFAEMFSARAAEEAAAPPPVFIGLPVVRDYIFDGHAGAGPSGAERWMNCTMSLSASRKFLETLTPNQQRAFAGAGTAARQGTTAHAAAEVKANHVLGRVDETEVDHTLLELSVNPENEDEAFSDEMEEFISEYVDLIRQYAQDRGDENVHIESRVEAAIPLVGVHEGEVYVIRGSADATVLPIPADPTLVVGDLKYGNGIDVDVDENPQIRLYALGKLEELADPETGELPEWVTDVIYHIIQPRLGGIKTWTESVDDLLAWRDDVLAPALTLALYGEPEGATYAPSELACQWCPARGGCPALTEARVEAAADLFDVIVEAEYADGPGAFPETTTLSPERLGELLTMVAGLKNIYTDLREEAQRRLHRGEEVPGYWLVNYSPNRQWKEGAEQTLADYTALWKTDPVLLSPTQAEKVLGRTEDWEQAILPLIDKPDKRPVISTGAADKRKRWEGKPPEAMFADESEGDSDD